MNAILLHPQNAAQAKIFRETAEKQGVRMVSISKKILEDFDNMLFAEKMVERDKSSKIVNHVELKATLNRLINKK